MQLLTVTCMSLVLRNKGKGMQRSSEQPLVGEERYVTTLITAAKETIIYLDDFLLLAAPVEEAVKNTQLVVHESPSVPRFFNKPQQIITNSNTSDNLPGFPNRLNAHDAISPGRKNRQNCRLLSPFARFSRYHIAKPSKLNRFALRDRFCRPQLQYFTSLFLALNISALPSLAANYPLLSRQPTTLYSPGSQLSLLCRRWQPTTL